MQEDYWYSTYDECVDWDMTVRKVRKEMEIDRLIQKGVIVSSHYEPYTVNEVTIYEEE